MLSLVFLVVVSLVMVALASWAVNDLNNTHGFRGASTKLYAAGGATEVAIDAMRYTYSSTTNGPCLGTPSPIQINGYFIEDWCQVTFNVSPTATREVTFTACLMPSATSSLEGDTPCTVNGAIVPALMTAVVDFDDHTLGENPGNPNCTATNTVCGQSMTLMSWLAQ